MEGGGFRTRLQNDFDPDGRLFKIAGNKVYILAESVPDTNKLETI